MTETDDSLETRIGKLERSVRTLQKTVLGLRKVLMVMAEKEKSHSLPDPKPVRKIGKALWF